MKSDVFLEVDVSSRSYLGLPRLNNYLPLIFRSRTAMDMKPGITL